MKKNASGGYIEKPGEWGNYKGFFHQGYILTDKGTKIRALKYIEGTGQYNIGSNANKNWLPNNGMR